MKKHDKSIFISILFKYKSNSIQNQFQFIKIHSNILKSINIKKKKLKKTIKIINFSLKLNINPFIPHKHVLLNLFLPLKTCGSFIYPPVMFLPNLCFSSKKPAVAMLIFISIKFWIKYWIILIKFWITNIELKSIINIE
jgi:TATA-box binding protein (TBP) (component of TFIID and TFIIIB)